MSLPRPVWIVDGVRTPIGRYGGALSTRAHRRPRRPSDQGADAAQSVSSIGRRSTT